MNAATSSSLIKFSKVTTHGDGCFELRTLATGVRGSLTTCGLYCGKSRRIRWYVVEMSPGWMAGGVFGGRLHARRFSSHVWHDSVHCSCMKLGLALHSPADAHDLHEACLSSHPKASRIVLMWWHTLHV